MKDQTILDQITLDDGTTLTGIVDFVNKKHVSFYDLTDNNNPVLTLLIIQWKATEPDTRFTVYYAKNGFKLPLPSITLILRKTIVHSSRQISEKDFQHTQRNKTLKIEDRQH